MVCVYKALYMEIIVTIIYIPVSGARKNRKGKLDSTKITMMMGIFFCFAKLFSMLFDICIVLLVTADFFLRGPKSKFNLLLLFLFETY